MNIKVRPKIAISSPIWIPSKRIEKWTLAILSSILKETGIKSTTLRKNIPSSKTAIPNTKDSSSILPKKHNFILVKEIKSLLLMSYSSFKLSP